MAPTVLSVTVTSFDEEPDDSEVTSGGFDFDASSGDYTNLAEGSDSTYNVLEFDTDFCPNVEASTTFVATDADATFGLGVRRVDSSSAMTSGFCAGTTGYMCLVVMSATDDDDSASYYYQLNYCNTVGEMSTIEESDAVSDSLSLNTEYALTFSMEDYVWTCAVTDSDDTEVSSFSYTSTGSHYSELGKGQVSLMVYGTTTYFADYSAVELSTC